MYWIWYAFHLIYIRFSLVAGFSSVQPGQSEAAPAALLEARAVSVLTARTDPGGHHPIHKDRSAERETQMSLRCEVKLLC